MEIITITVNGLVYSARLDEVEYSFGVFRFPLRICGNAGSAYVRVFVDHLDGTRTTILEGNVSLSFVGDRIEAANFWYEHPEIENILGSVTSRVPSVSSPEYAPTRCVGCGAQTDPTTCWCGSPPNEHTSADIDGHSFVAAGCECMYSGGIAALASIVISLEPEPAPYQLDQVAIDAMQNLGHAISRAVAYWIPCRTCGSVSCLDHGGRVRGAALASALLTLRYATDDPPAYVVTALAAISTMAMTGPARRGFRDAFIAERSRAFEVGPERLPERCGTTQRFELVELG